jgi:ligand-binding sensor domain-containing protein
MKNKIFALLIIALFVASCENEELVVDKKIVADLNDKEISSLVIDKSNTLWAGTDDGLYKSSDDGYKLENSVISGKILSLGYEGSSNTLWIGTTNGLIQATIGTNDLTAKPVDASYLSNDQVNSTCIDNESKCWFGTDNGITMNNSGVYKNEKFLTNILGDKLPLDIEDYKVNCIAFWDGDYYFATSGRFLYRAYNYVDSIDAFTGASILEPPYNGMSITDTMYVVFVDSQGRQWMGGTNGLQSHTGHNTKMNVTYFIDELPDSHIHAITEAPDGKIWAGTEKGITVFSESTWTTITDSLPDLFVTAIAFDKADSSAWIGTKKGLANLK